MTGERERPLPRDILIAMNRRGALLLSISVPGLAQIAQALEAERQSQRRRAAASPQDSIVRWNPRPVFNGAPVLFMSKTYSGPATWLGKMIEFRPDGNSFSALAGVNLNRSTGRYPLALGG